MTTSRTTRTTARYNSPFAPLPNTPNTARPAVAAADAVEKPKTSLDKWLEPALSTRASFQDHGFERAGVLKEMMPLGTLPSAKILKAATRPEATEFLGRGGAAKKSTASSVSTPRETLATPEPTINSPQLAPADAQAEMKDATTPPALPATPQDPHTPTQEEDHRRSVSTNPRPVVNGQAYGPGAGQTVFSVQNSPVPAAIPYFVPKASPWPPHVMGADGDWAIDMLLTDAVVEAAVQHALDHRRWPTAYALRTIYDEHRSNTRMVRLIDAIYAGRAEEQQIKEFTAVMAHKKKEGRKDRTAEYYFNGSPPAHDSHFFVPASQSPSRNNKDSSLGAAGSSSNVQARALHSSMSASPSKDEHVRKKQRLDNYPPPAEDVTMDDGHAKGGEMMQSALPNGASSGPRAGRSRSVSTSSSLSSVDEAVLHSGQLSNSGSPQRKNVVVDAKGESQSQSESVSGSGSSDSHPGPGPRNQTQPINADPLPGPKMYTFQAPSTTLHPPQKKPVKGKLASKPAANDHAMAPIALSPPSTSSPPPADDQPSVKAKKDAIKKLDENDVPSRLKREARTRTRGPPVLDSFERMQVQSAQPETTEAAGATSDAEEATTVLQPAKRVSKLRLNVNGKNVNGKRTRQSSAVNDDSDAQSSPTQLGFQPDQAPGSRAASRAGTPNIFNRTAKKGKPASGLRVKISPMKKKGGTSAGIPRASGERSPIAFGAAPKDQDENDDYCSSCGGNGKLVCCDSCTRSFHFKCADPYVDENNEPAEWSCNACIHKNTPRRPADETGCFGPLLFKLQRKNPTAFHLPKDIREYFENVKTGAEGEYEEAVPPKAKERKGWDEAPDYYKLKDSKGKAILCHQCNGAATPPNHGIIQCTFCSLNWHTDCLPVPLAKEPPAGRPWRCPAHVDDLVASIPSALAPAHRFRKIKGASVIKPAIARGIKNNGHIEIENEGSEDEAETGFYEHREFGRVYLLSERAIKLDFIAQVRKSGGGFVPPAPKPATAAPSRLWDQRSLGDQQAALNLAAVAFPAAEGQGDKTRALLDTVIAEAPPAVVAMIAQGTADNIVSNKLSKTDIASLKAMRALLDSKLAQAELDDAPADVEMAG